jgi:hypothetical protein
MVLKSPLGFNSEALLPSVQLARKSKNVEMTPMRKTFVLIPVNSVVDR